MAGSLNKVMLIGHLGRDPEIRTTNGGDRIANLSLATSESWRDKTTGERRERTEWHRVVIFNDGLAKIAEQYLRNGSAVYVEGSLQTRKWQAQDGTDRYSTEIVLKPFNGTLKLMDGKQTADSPAQSNGAGERQSSIPGRTSGPPPEHPPFDDEIPF